MRRIYLALLLPLYILSSLHAEDAGKEKIYLLEKARAIDEIILKQLKEEKLPAPSPASDHVFLRRLFLTSVGRIPTLSEKARFSKIENEQDRQDLIFYLYQQPGYTSHMTNWAMDLLRLRDKNQKGYEADPLIHWVRKEISENSPWDEVARELVTAEGNAWIDNGAAGYYAMDLGMQNDNLANTVFSFHGVKMECAQCHDDPFQQWERMDFYQLSALVNGEIGINFKTGANFRQLATEQPEKFHVKEFGRLNDLEQDIRYMISFGNTKKKGRGIVKLPADWQYEDGDPGEVITARTPFGMKYKSSFTPHTKMKFDLTEVNKITDKKERKVAFMEAKKDFELRKKKAKAGPGNGLEVFGDWLTSDETPHFSQTIALRMWERVMGFSLTETLGHYVNPEESAFPELITYLSALMKEYDYDLKSFQTTLALTSAFRAETLSGDYLNGDPKNLMGRRLNRMSAEQLWDSMLAFTVKQPDTLPKRTLQKTFIYKGYEIGPIEELVAELGDLEKEDYKNRIMEIYTGLVEGKYPKRGSRKKESDLTYERNLPKNLERNEYTEKILKAAEKDFKNIRPYLKRASELSSPINTGHFLSTFGQSSRLNIDDSSREGTVTQALMMYNGAVQRHVVNNRSSALRLMLVSLKNPEMKIKVLFRAILSREPTEQELEMCLSEIQGDIYHGQLDILAALLCSQEFLFIS